MKPRQLIYPHCYRSIGKVLKSVHNPLTKNTGSMHLLPKQMRAILVWQSEHIVLMYCFAIHLKLKYFL